jgi:GTPase
MPLRIAIVGRPNVGKSTLFNRLAGKQLAIVDDQPGVTRDRKHADGDLAGLALDLIDTAGFEEADAGSLEARMRAQTEAAIADCDLALFLIDARAGVTPLDESFADLLRRSGKPIVLAANKAEGRQGEEGVLEAWSLGLGEPIGLSAEHGEGFAELFGAIRVAVAPELFDAALAEGETGAGEEARLEAELLERLEDIDVDDPELNDAALAEKLAEAGIDTLDAAPAMPVDDRPIRLAIIGRPNAGKSTLINQLLQSERLLTGPEAGITRDSISVDWEWEGRRIKLVDTAGLRRKSRVSEKLEKMSTGETIRALKYADIVALVMDSHEAFEKQDLQIADLVLREGRGLVFVISKWDMVESPDEAAKEYNHMLREALPMAAGAPLIFLSGLTGRRVDRLMPAVIKTYDDWNAKVKTGDLNRWLRAVVERHPPPAVRGGQRIKPRYMAQLKGRPPTFVLMASRGDDMPEGYKRYLINGIREAFDLKGVPIRLHVRQGKNPYADKSGGRRR